MKHINITNWQGNITDWTKFNYVYGGLDKTIADRVNLSIPGTNLRNYIKKSDNLIQLSDVAEITLPSGLTYKVENGVITTSGKITSDITIYFDVNIPTGTYSYNGFSEKTTQFRGKKSYIGGWASFNAKNFANGIAQISIYYKNGATANEVIKPMLVKSTTAPTTYEPYGSMVLVENVGKTYVDSSWVYDASTLRVRNTINSMKVQTTRTLPIQMNGYKCVSDGASYDSEWDKVIYNANTDQLPYVYITNKSYISRAQWIEKEGNNPIIYPLAEPKVTVFGPSQSNANMLGMVKPAPTAIEDSMSLDELLEPANEER